MDDNGRLYEAGLTDGWNGTDPDPDPVAANDNDYARGRLDGIGRRRETWMDRNPNGGPWPGHARDRLAPLDPAAVTR